MAVHLCCCELGIVRSDLGHDTSRPTSHIHTYSHAPVVPGDGGRARVRGTDRQGAQRSPEQRRRASATPHVYVLLLLLSVGPPPGVLSFYCCLRASPARRSRGPPDLPACAGASATPLRPCSAPCATSTRLDRHGISLREKHRVHLCCCELGIVRSDLGHDTSRPTSLRACSSLPCGAWAGRVGFLFLHAL